MSSTKYILGSFADPDDMMHGIDKLQENNISIYDCFTPMPIHGIEAKLGVKPSRLPIAAFCFGITGLVSGISLLYYTIVYDWPMNIGGKPALAMPDFVPVSFELTILFCALGMVATFFFRNHLFPGRAPRVMDLRATDDRFIIAIDAKENTDYEKINSLLKEAGAVDVLHNERKYVSYE
ncbi:quinol:cytochrome c oxidoreductase membrane protein [bacterium A37T11]|nr:quinol:cytochrome c oxidoreductase membrane protein [bacterium A37T11]